MNMRLKAKHIHGDCAFTYGIFVVVFRIENRPYNNIHFCDHSISINNDQWCVF